MTIKFKKKKKLKKLQSNTQSIVNKKERKTKSGGFIAPKVIVKPKKQKDKNVQERNAIKRFKIAERKLEREKKRHEKRILKEISKNKKFFEKKQKLFQRNKNREIKIQEKLFKKEQKLIQFNKNKELKKQQKIIDRLQKKLILKSRIDTRINRKRKSSYVKKIKIKKIPKKRINRWYQIKKEKIKNYIQDTVNIEFEKIKLGNNIKDIFKDASLKTLENAKDAMSEGYDSLLIFLNDKYLPTLPDSNEYKQLWVAKDKNIWKWANSLVSENAEEWLWDTKTSIKLPKEFLERLKNLQNNESNK